MVGTMATLLVVAALVGAAGGASVPSFSFSYNNGDQPTGGVSQFYSGPSSAFVYNWGYQYPGRSHSESKSYDGTVQGRYTFVDANGEVQQALYRAAPGVGFNVEQTALGMAGPSDVPLPYNAPVLVAPPAVVPLPGISQGVYSAPVPVAPLPGISQDVYSALARSGVGLDIGSKQAIEKASPTLLAAVRAGTLVPLRGGGSELVFRVTDELVDEAKGSVSALAVLLDADTVAARHDPQVVRPYASFYSAPDASATRAILETEYLPGGPVYVVKVPYTH